MPAGAHEQQPANTEVTNIGSAVLARAINYMTEHIAPNFGPFGIPNELDGRPDPNSKLDWHEDFSIFNGKIPAYIVASREYREGVA